MIDPNMTPEKALYLLGQMGYDQQQVDELIRQRRQQQAYPIGQAPTGAPPTTIGALPPHMVPPPEEKGGIVEGFKQHPLQYGLGMGAGLLTAAATGGPDPSDAVVFPTVTKAVAGALKTLPGRIAISGGMSALGGWAGRGMENAYRMERNMPRAPRSLMDAYEQQAYAALEEGAADIAGNVAGEGIRAGGNVLRKLPYARRILAPMAPTVRPGFEGASERLSKAMAKIPKEELSEREYKTLWRRKYLIAGPRRPVNIGATIGQQIEAPLLDIGENVASASLFGSKRMRPLKEVLQPKGVNIMSREASDIFWDEVGQRMSQSEVGQLVDDSLKLRSKQVSQVSRGLYGELKEITGGIIDVSSLARDAKRFGVAIDYAEQLMPGWEKALAEAGIDISPVQASITKMKIINDMVDEIYVGLDDMTRGMDPIDLRPLKRAAVRAYNEAALSAKAGESAKIMSLTEKIQNFPDFVDTFMKAHKIKSNVLKDARLLEKEFHSKLPDTKRVADNAADLIKKIMKRAAESYDARRGMGNLAQEALEKANNFTAKAYEEMFSNKVINGMAKLAENPKTRQMVSSWLFKPNAAASVQAAKRVLPPKTFKAMVAAKMEELLIPPEGEKFLGKTFLKKFNGLGDDVLEQMMSKEMINDMRELGLAARLTQDPIGGRGGGMLIQLTQAGAVVGLATGGLITDSPKAKRGAVILLLGPAALGRIMTNPTGIKWLTRGLTMPNWTPAATAAGIKILKAARGAPDIEGPKVPETLSANTQSGYVDPFEYDPYIHGAPKAQPRDKPLIGLPKPGRILPPLFGEDEQQAKQNLLLKTTR